MKYVRRILSGLELLAGYLFLLFLSYAFTRNRGTGILDMPSYYREVSRSPLLIVGGAAVLLALFASLFSWIRTKLDLRAEATRREMIRTDVTEKTPKRPAMPGFGNMPANQSMAGNYGQTAGETDILVGQDVPAAGGMSWPQAAGASAVSDATEFVGPQNAYRPPQPQVSDATEFVRPQNAYRPPAPQVSDATEFVRPQNAYRPPEPQVSDVTEFAGPQNAYRPQQPAAVPGKSAAAGPKVYKPQVYQPQSGKKAANPTQVKVYKPGKPAGQKTVFAPTGAAASHADRIWIQEEEDDEE